MISCRLGLWERSGVVAVEQQVLHAQTQLQGLAAGVGWLQLRLVSKLRLMISRSRSLK